MKRALILGVTGQDGSYLAKLLLEKGYAVIGTSRFGNDEPNKNHKILGINNELCVQKTDISNKNDVCNLILKSEPDEIYILAGQSSVGFSFNAPDETFRSFVDPLRHVLETCRKYANNLKIYHAGSSEIFGHSAIPKCNESTEYNPVSPYGVAKVCATTMVKNYRELYGINACTGILFNHESPLRSNSFVTKKIIDNVKKIKYGNGGKLALGSLDISRDWGWAPEYTDAMWRMLQRDKFEDLVIATGRMASLEEFVEIAFNLVGLNWRNHVYYDMRLDRKSEIEKLYGDSSLAKEKINWNATVQLETTIEKMLMEQYI